MKSIIKISHFLCMNILVLIATDLYGQTPKYSNEFLSLGVGARSYAMSNSVIATSDDVFSGIINPAGLAHINEDRQVGLMHNEHFAGIAKNDYGSISFKIDNTGTLAFSFFRVSVDDIPNTIDIFEPDGSINYNRIRSFSVSDNAFFISFAKKNNEGNLAYGGNLKLIHRKAGSFAKAYGFGVDLGMQFQKNNVYLGLNARDITTTFNAWSFNLSDDMKTVFYQTGNDIPENSIEITLPKFLMGVAYQFKVKNNFSILPELNLDLTSDGKRNVLIKSDPFSIDPHMGIEINYKNFVFLRSGVGLFQQETNNQNEKFTSFQPNIGIGVNIKDAVKIDYALTDIGNNSSALYSNIFSLIINFKKQTKNNP